MENARVETYPGEWVVHLNSFQVGPPVTEDAGIVFPGGFPKIELGGDASCEVRGEAYLE